MAFFSNHTPVLLGVYDNELFVSHFTAENNGKILGRDSLENVHHSGGSPEFHPTLPVAIKNTSGHIYLAGTFTVTFEWPAGEVTEQDMDSYIELLAGYNIPPGVFDVTKDVSNNAIIVSMTDPQPAIADWSGYLTPWLPNAPKATLVSTSDASEFLCVTRANNTFSNYTFDQRTIESGDTLTVSRPESTLCFIIFTKDVSVGGKTLTKNKAYKLTSNSIEVTNISSDRALVLRYYRD